MSSLENNKGLDFGALLPLFGGVLELPLVISQDICMQNREICMHCIMQLSAL